MKNEEKNCDKTMKLPAIMFLLVLLISCSSNLKKEIIGKWKEIKGAEVIEIFEDGNITLDSKWMKITGRYKFMEKDTIGVQFNTSGPLQGPFVAQVSVKDDKLTWVMPDGRVSEYQRVK